MKKIFILILVFISYMFVGCDKNKSIDSIEGIVEYASSLESYTYSSDMLVKRNSKEMKLCIDVIYKKPYYCVSYSNDKLEKQFIVKNKDGVYVLTPKADKKFEFSSDWPLNSSHAYILASLINDISLDKAASITVDNDIASIKACASSKTNSNVKSLLFTFDVKNKLPLAACFKGENDESVIEVTFKSFIANKAINDDEFNVDLIMSKNQNESTSTVPDDTKSLSVGYLLENATLTSQTKNEECQILCYSVNDKSYNIIAKELGQVEFNGVYSFNDLDLVANGLVMYDDSRVYMIYNNMEISVYSNNLTKDELYNVISGIELI